MARHELKTWPEYFRGIRRGDKHFEIRADDRGGYEIGDDLVLREWDPARDAYTGQTVVVRVTTIVRGPMFGVRDGFVVMGIELPAEAREARMASHAAVLDTAALPVLLGAALGSFLERPDIATGLIIFAAVLVAAALHSRTQG